MNHSVWNSDITPAYYSREKRWGRFQNMVEAVVSSTDKYKELAAKTAELEEHIFFRRLLSGNVSSADLHRRTADFPGKGNLCYVLLVELEGQPDLHPEQMNRRSNERLSIGSTVRKLSHREGIRLWNDWLAPHQLCILMFLQVDKKQQLHSFCREFQTVVEKQTDCTAVVAIGKPVERLADIPYAFQTAVQLMEFKHGSGPTRILDHKTAVPADLESLYRLLPHLQAAAAHLRLGQALWEAEWTAWYSQLVTGLYPRKHIVNQLDLFMYYLTREIEETSETFRLVWQQEILPELMEAIREFWSLDSLQTRILPLLRQTAESFESLRSDQGNHGNFEKMQGIKEYILENFGDPHLSLVQISERFEMSPSNVSTLFKEVFRENFIHYVTRIRMEQAKTLLDTTSDTVQEVALQVGYVHSVSFIRVFKKLVGRTPGDYRKVLRIS